jgi:hypothetical protein
LFKYREMNRMVSAWQRGFCHGGSSTRNHEGCSRPKIPGSDKPRPPPIVPAKPIGGGFCLSKPIPARTSLALHPHSAREANGGGLRLSKPIPGSDKPRPPPIVPAKPTGGGLRLSQPNLHQDIRQPKFAGITPRKRCRRCRQQPRHCPSNKRRRNR